MVMRGGLNQNDPYDSVVIRFWDKLANGKEKDCQSTRYHEERGTNTSEPRRARGFA